MKKSMILGAVLLASTSLFAKQDIYVGAGFGIGSGDITSTVNTYGFGLSSDYDLSSNYFKIGLESFDDKHRLELSYDKQEFDYADSSTDEITGFNLDYLYVLDSNTNFHPYLGAGLGFYSFENTAQYFVDNEDLKGLALNINLGAVYNLNENFEIEIGYKHQNISWQDISVGYSTISTDTSTNKFFTGLNYKF